MGDMFNLYSGEPQYEDFKDDADEKYGLVYEEWRENRKINLDPKIEPYEKKKKEKKKSRYDDDNGDDDTKKNNKSRYDGGVWHVEGMGNESIVASGIYYFQNENITESHLSFRTNVREPDYEQDDKQGVKAVYGLEDESQLVQNLGSIICHQGRVVVWPNTYQHKVQPFELLLLPSSAKKSNTNGVRKILVFFLVDPAIRIVSTSIVPPQQQSWMQEEIKSKKSLGSTSLPSDVVQHLIVDKMMDWHFTHNMALQYRKELMEERKYLIHKNTEEKFERLFSLCEH